MAQRPDVKVDREVPNAARIYHYFLGGSNYYPVDMAAADAATGAWKESAKLQTRAHRDWIGRVVRALVNEYGVTQFLDIGTGIPDEDNVTRVAQGANPACRVVSVDNDPSVIALAYDEGLLGSTPEGAATFIDGDIRRHPRIIREAHRTLDFDKPIALMLTALLHFLDTERDDPAGILAHLLDSVASGSFLVVSHLSLIPPHHEQTQHMVDTYNERTKEHFVLRTPKEIAAFFAGLDVLEPGVVPVHEWRPDSQDPMTAPLVGGVGRKP